VDVAGMDLILCRNVLMYFRAAQMQQAIARLEHALLPGGWLVVSPCETSSQLFARFETRNLPGAVLYRRHGGEPVDVGTIPSLSVPSAAPPVVTEPATAPAPLPVPPAAAKPAPDDSIAAATALHEAGHYAAAVDVLLGNGRAVPAAAMPLLTYA